MSLFISSLNSGSNGNCYFIGNKNEAILIDAGISCRTIEQRMKSLHLDINLIKAVFVSHEHSDHIKGIEILSKKYNLPVYISELTYRHSGLHIHKNNLVHFSDSEVMTFGKISVHAFRKIHDAKDPYSFCACDDEVQIGIFTDLGRCCENVTKWFSGCHAAFLEANYDEKMLSEGPYPYYLKQRISDGRGHLSNTIAHRLFTEYRSEHLTHLILSHLSEKNNSPLIVQQLFDSNSDGVNIIVAPRTEATPVYEITNGKHREIKAGNYFQTSLFSDHT